VFAGASVQVDAAVIIQASVVAYGVYGCGQEQLALLV